MNLREIRNKYNLTLSKISEITGVPKRTYIRYEKDDEYGNELLRDKIVSTLIEYIRIDETHGILSLKDVNDCIKGVLLNHKEDIKYCYLFGSYAKGYAKAESDVDILVGTNLQGLRFVSLKNEFQTALNKNVDLVRGDSLSDNPALLDEILKDGIKINE